ncbi:hypothetical protein [Leifsonia sp. 2MCAF36]|uniref:hypothetical protein n=1 Tax=Leifsonia sp. 2MCAF36 TaxID=3232988 RepID=UPI003F955870
MLKKTLIPALLIAGLTTTALAACTAPTDKAPTSSAAASAAAKVVNGSGGAPSDIPVLAKDVVASSNHYGSTSSGSYTLNLKTKSNNAKDDAVKLLTDAGFKKEGTSGTYSNDKWTVTVVGLGGNVTYTVKQK